MAESKITGREIDQGIARSRQAMPQPWEGYWASVDYLMRLWLRRDRGLATEDVKFRNPEMPQETTTCRR